MSIHRRRAAMAAILLLPCFTAGCGLYTRPTSEDREARVDCDAQADRIFAARNRYLLSEGDSHTDSPYSANTLPSNPNAGLSDRYEQEKLVDSCLAQKGGSPAAAQTPEAPIKR